MTFVKDPGWRRILVVSELNELMHLLMLSNLGNIFSDQNAAYDWRRELMPNLSKTGRVSLLRRC